MHATVCLIHLLSEGATLSQTALAAGGLTQNGGTAGAKDDALKNKNTKQRRNNFRGTVQ